MRSKSAWRWVMVAAAAILLIEYQVLFVDREGVFRIEGEQPYEVEAFASGQPVKQAFLMQGGGLHSVEVLVASEAATTIPIVWRLWRGHPDRANPPVTLAFERREDLTVENGRHWTAFSFPRDSTSNDRWYTFEIGVESQSRSPSSARTTLIASHDNPDRGGVFWVGEQRQPGSLFMRAERRGQTMYRRFRAEATPHLPRWLQLEAVQWVIFALCHCALVVYLGAIGRQAWPAS